MSHVYNYFKHFVEGIDFPDDIGDFQGPEGMFAKHYDVIIHLAAFAALGIVLRILRSSGRIM